MHEVLTIEEAAERLPELLARVAAGERFLIGRNGRAEAKLLAADQPSAGRRRLGLLAGKLKIPAGDENPLLQG